MDAYSYQCGVIDAFNEIVSSGVKELALSHPSSAKEVYELLPFVIGITQKYGTFYEVESDLLITDLFPISANKGKTVILFWKEADAIEKYKELKKEQIPRYYMQIRYGSTFSKNKSIRIFSTFADAILFKDGALWRDS